MPNKIVIATRGSKLALWQAEHIASLLRNRYSGLEVELKIIKTSGDKILDVPLAKVGGKGLFVKEIEEALLEGSADLAVHSMKDVPAEMPSGLKLGVIPERDDPTDCYLSKHYPDLDSLPQGSVMGTSSLRRQAQLLAKRPDLEIRTLRGNLDTRLRKLDEDQFDAIVLASVGLKRLGVGARYQERLGPPEFLPAVGQGTLGIEYVQARQDLDDFLGFMNHRSTFYQAAAERAFLHRLEGGCQVPIAAYAQIMEENLIHFTGLVADVQGKKLIRREVTGKNKNAEKLGVQIADEILEAGGREILEEVYCQP